MKILITMGAVALALQPLTSSAQPAADPQAVVKRLDALEASQNAIRQQLEEIKALLQAISAAPPLAPPMAPAPVEVVTELETTIAASPLRGASGAQFAFIEYSDFQCPFCGRHFQQVASSIEREFIETGRMKYSFRHFPLNIHPQAPQAAEASECAREQGKFWEMHDALFANQQALMEPDLSRYAATIGLDGAKFQQCLTGNVMSAKLRTDAAEGVRLGVRSTPTFFVGRIQPDGSVKLLRKITGAQPYTIFKAALDSALADK